MLLVAFIYRKESDRGNIIDTSICRVLQPVPVDVSTCIQVEIYEFKVLVAVLKLYSDLVVSKMTTNVHFLQCCCFSLHVFVLSMADRGWIFGHSADQFHGICQIGIVFIIIF